MEDANEPIKPIWQTYLAAPASENSEPGRPTTQSSYRQRAKLGRAISRRRIGLAISLGLVSGALLTILVQVIWQSPKQESFSACLEKWQFSKNDTASKNTVFIAPLLNDSSGAATSQLQDSLNAFERKAGVTLLEFQSVPCFISADELSVFGGANEAEKAAKHLADVTGATAVIWGGVLERQQQLELFATYTKGLGGQLHSSDQFMISAEPSDMFGEIVAASIWLSTQNPAHSREQKSTDDLRNVLDMLSLDEIVAAELFEQQDAQRQHVIAQAQFQLGVQERDASLLEKAVEGFAIAAETFSNGGFYENWAEAQNNLGLSLLSFGRMQSSLPEIDMAISSFERALTQSNRVRAPLKWAAATVNLADALSVLGPQEPNDEKLSKAVDAYRSALHVYTLERAPLEWASLQHSLGAVFKAIGQKHRDFDAIKQSVDAFGLALQIRTPEISQAGFIASQINLGESFEVLAELGAGETAMISATEAYRAALSQLDRQTRPIEWATLQHSFGRSLLALANVRPSLEILKKASQAFMESLTVFSKDDVPAMWGVAQNNLGNSLQELGKRNRDMATVQAAIKAYEGSLEVFSDTSPSYAKSVVQNLSYAHALLQSLNKANQ
ncbi:MAG: hypothetical protein ABJO09_07315 [Hyphomicrobiales bacterium]